MTIVIVSPLDSYNSVDRSRPYYETRANYNGLLKAQKNRITDLETRVRDAKLTYNEALRLLEQISEEIHRQRGIDARALAAAAGGSSSAADDDDITKTTASMDSAVVLESQQDEELVSGGAVSFSRSYEKPRKYCNLFAYAKYFCEDVMS